MSKMKGFGAAAVTLVMSAGVFYKQANKVDPVEEKVDKTSQALRRAYDDLDHTLENSPDYNQQKRIVVDKTTDYRIATGALCEEHKRKGVTTALELWGACPQEPGIKVPEKMPDGANPK